MRKAVSVAGIVLGLLLIVAAAATRYVVAPAAAVLPSDTDTTRTYSGTAAVLLNPAALTAPGSGPVRLSNVPITVVHHTKVLGAKSGSALVSDAKAVQVGGKPVATVDYRYAVDRSDLGPGSGYSGVVAQRGLTFNWPIDTGQQDYTGWVADTHKTTALHYSGKAKRGGISTYVFKTSTEALPIADDQVLSTLPKGLPKATLTKLAAGLNLTPAQLSTFQAVLPSLPEPVPFSYTYQVTATYWVAPVSGVVVDLDQHEVRTLNISLGGASVPVTSVSDITFTSPASTLKAAAKDAGDARTAIGLVSRTLPLALLVAGGVLLGLGLIGVVRGRRSAAQGAGGGQPVE